MRGGSVILIVVDRNDLRAAFNRCLKNTPHRLVFTPDGEDAFDRFSEVKPDLIIADINSPRLDGSFLCQLIRKEPHGLQVPFVLLGEELEGDEAASMRIKAAGADAALEVPFTAGQVRDVLGPLLSFGRVRDVADALDAPVVPSARLRSKSLTQPTVPPVEEAVESNTVLDVEADEFNPDEQMLTIDGAVPFESGGEDDIPTGLTEVPESFDPLEEPEAPIPVEQQRDADEDTRVEEVSLDQLGVPVAAPAEEPTPAPIPMNITEAMAAEPTADISAVLPPPPAPPVPASEGIRSEGLLEEPMLPDPAETSSGDAQPSGARIVKELPREATPSKLEPIDGPARRGRKGLDESQLGKRLARRVRTMHDALETMDYYELLGVEPKSERAGVRDAYFRLSLEFHPDRFFFIRSGDVKEKIYAIFRRVSEAYAVLSDEKKRALYDDQLARGGDKRLPVGQRTGAILRSEPPPPPRPLGRLDVATRTSEGNRFVSLAQAAFAAEDPGSARLYLSFAYVYEQSAELKAAIRHVARSEMG